MSKEKISMENTPTYDVCTECGRTWDEDGCRVYIGAATIYHKEEFVCAMCVEDQARCDGGSDLEELGSAIDPMCPLVG